MKLIVITVFLVSYTMGLTLPYQQIDIEDKDYWQSVGSNTLDNILKRKFNDGVAKNVIIFIGDGMGMTTITAARIYQGQTQNKNGESNVLSFEKFPAVGLSKTYSVDRQVSDSASTATAMFTGAKTKQNVIGLDARADYDRCNAELNQRAEVSTMMTWAQEKGKDTGIVTTTRITHATPASTYAHTNNRDWECDGDIPRQDQGCVKDIARQLVESSPGNLFKVILGGGLKQLGDFSENSTEDSCWRTDKKNLTQQWLSSKKNARLVKTAQELSAVDTNKTDYLLGLFAPGHLSYVGENVTTRPSLKLMATTAVKMLAKNEEGYVLMVEGGRIDQAHHKNYAKLAMMETVEFDEAISAVVDMVNLEETLVIVTADHSHPLTINGYPKRGNDILGLAQNTSKTVFETLTYANGPGFAYHHLVNQTEIKMGSCQGPCSQAEQMSAGLVRDIRNDQNRTTNVHYQNMAAFYLKDDNHGGEDVPIYAIGPKAHLLIGVHEQNYIAHVISYASCIGPEKDRCRYIKQSNSSSQIFAPCMTLLTALLTFIFQ